MILSLLYLFSMLSLANTHMVTHVTDFNGLFQSRVILENPGIETQAYTFTPYSSDGTALSSVTGSLPAGTSLSYTISDLFSEPEQVSHFLVDGDISATITYTIKDGPGSPAHVDATTQKASCFKIFSGDWNVVFDGIAVVNAGDHAVDVWITQRDSQGKIIQSIKGISQLGVMAKGLYVIGAPAGSSFNPDNGTSFEVYSEQPLYITALRGTPPGADTGFLWENSATARSHASSSRDNQGVWFIEDGSLYDVMEMMGYNIATDRLWQIEQYRRSARGTLAEIYGTAALEQDILVRTTGYSDQELDDGYAALPQQARVVISAYIHGINRRIGEVHSDASILPFEFKALGLTHIADWDSRDILAWGALLQRNFDPSDYALGESENAALLQALMDNYPTTAMDMFNDLFYLNDPDAPTMIPGPASKTAQSSFSAGIQLRQDTDFAELAANLRGRKDRIDDFLRSINAKVKMGSYAWVVSGDKTHSGNPILYSGPQMGFPTPSIVCEGSIRGGGLNISGMTVPGIPGIIIGRTPHHAWSMQVGEAHSADLYLENPGALSSGPHRMETIKVAGSEDVVIPVYRTAHGPVVATDPSIVSWKYAHWDYEFDMVTAMYQFATAESMDDFGEGIEKMAVSQHFCYADNDGNIAYWMSGRDPVRGPGEYRLPQGAVAPPQEWDSAVLRERSHDRNTYQGFYGGWNNKTNPDYPNAPYGSHTQYGPFHRAHTVQDYLSTHDDLTYEEVRDLAINIASTSSFGRGGNPWQFVKARFTSIIEANPTDSRTAALNLLNSWDGHFVAGGEVHWINGQDRADAWVLMDTFLRKVLDMTFEEVSGVSTLNLFNVLLHGTGDYTLTNHYDWFKNAGDASAPQTLDDIVLAALDASLNELGDQPWGVNARGYIEYKHAMIPNGPIHRTPFGSRSTYAHCVEFDSTGPIRIESMFPLGENGFIGLDDTGTPVFPADFFSLTPFYDGFTPRTFPLFK
jgi:penicillin amidase